MGDTLSSVEIRQSGHPWKYLSKFYKTLKLILRGIKF